MQDENAHQYQSYQGLPELREVWLILCQKLWCSTQPRNRNFAFDKEGIMHFAGFE
jgi:hypothetical protein